MMFAEECLIIVFAAFHLHAPKPYQTDTRNKSNPQMCWIRKNTKYFRRATYQNAFHLNLHVYRIVMSMYICGMRAFDEMLKSFALFEQKKMATTRTVCLIYSNRIKCDSNWHDHKC